MVLVSSHRPQATHIPVLLPLFALVLLAGGVVSLQSGAWGAATGTLLIGGLTALLTVGQFRRIRATGSELLVSTPWATRRLPLDNVALGIRVYRSVRGWHTYTIYAHDGERAVDLVETSRDASARRLRDRLTRQLLAGRTTEDEAAAARDHVARHEQQWRAADARAMAQVDGYYASGKFHWVGLWIACVVLAYSVGMVIYFHFAGQ